ncbi:MAG: proton-conducting transporter membrane subunit [Desulfomonilaceae bacterium]
MTDMFNLFLLFLGTCGIGAILAAILPNRMNPPVLAWIASIASVLALSASGGVLLFGHPFHASLWQLPYFGTIDLDMDRISALFIFVTALVYLPVSIYSAEYMEKYRGRYSLKSFGVFYHLLFASVILTLVAGDVASFLIAWEVMTILSYLLVNYEHERQEVTRSGFLMLAMSEVGTVAAALGLLMIAGIAENFSFASLKSASGGLGQFARWAVFLLTFFGFGVKAGLLPGSTWLPRAHPVAPGNCSAILSGVILNLGIYGILRVNADLLPVSHPGQGILVLVVGSLSALIGILYATTENDMKKMLAHSSIENMGIITACLGAGFIFGAYGHASLAGIAFVVALYHMVNHSLYKALLFLGAGAVDSRVGGRDLNRLGGLIHRMPWTAVFFLVGALSIAALPPFNGFVTEWLTLQTLLQSSVLSSKGIKIAFALCGATLALTAALAVTCFVKAFAMSFLGMARSAEAEAAVEARRSATIPMGFLAAACILLGILPTCVIPVIDRVVTPVIHESVVDGLVPPFFTFTGEKDTKFSDAFVSEFHDLGAQVGRGMLPGRGLVVLHQGSERNPVIFAMSTSYTVIVLALLLGGSVVAVRLLFRGRRVEHRPVWDGGIRRLLPEMTYTATGFSNPVRVIFDSIFRPSMAENTRESIAGHFRTAIRNGRQETYIVDKLAVQPILRWARWLAAVAVGMHSARVNTYAGYVLISLLVVLVIQRLF